MSLQVQVDILLAKLEGQVIHRRHAQHPRVKINARGLLLVVSAGWSGWSIMGLNPHLFEHFSGYPEAINGRRYTAVDGGLQKDFLDLVFGQAIVDGTAHV